MYRALVDSRMKCYDSPGTGSQNKLKKALKKLFCDICETLISYHHRLEISGTIGITIDRESVLLLQFSEAFHNRKSASPTFHDDDDEEDDNVCGSKTGITNTGINNLKGAKDKCWNVNSPPSSSTREQKDHQNAVCRSSSSNNTIADADQRTENVSKNSSGSNLANSSDSNDCPVGLGHFESKLPLANGSLNSKNDAPAEPARNFNGEAPEAKPAKRNSSSMLSQLLQRPPSSTIEAYGNVMNQVWPAPVSASEMLKKLSNRVDGADQEASTGPDVKSSGKMKSESVCCPSLTQGKSSPCSSYLKELLFKKASGHQGQRVSGQKGMLDRKRKRTRTEPEMFFLENCREENGPDSFGSLSYQFAPLINSSESGPFLQYRQNLFSNSRKGNSPNLSSEFSEYQYSRMLHKLVRQTDSARGCNGPSSSVASEIPESVNNPEHSFGTLDQNVRFESESHARVIDPWSQGIKTEITDAELSESPTPLVKFDTGGGGNHTSDVGRDVDSC